MFQMEADKVHLAFVFELFVRPTNLHLLHDHSQLTLSSSNLWDSPQSAQSAACTKTVRIP